MPPATILGLIRKFVEIYYRFFIIHRREIVLVSSISFVRPSGTIPIGQICCILGINDQYHIVDIL